MKLRALIIFAILMTMMPVEGIAARYNILRNDTVKVSSSEAEQPLSDSLKPKSRRAVSGLMYDLLMKEERKDTLRDTKIHDINQMLEPYEGKTIGSITIVRTDVFETENKKIEKTINDLHIMTRERVVRRDLIFEEGDIFDPDIITKNISLLQSRKYIYDVDMELRLSEADTTVVDIVLKTQDSWTIGVDGSLSLGGKNTIMLYDANIAGSGNRLRVETSFDYSKPSYGGNQVQYDIPNILGTFYEGKFIAGKKFDRSDIGAQISKEFILPTDYELGASYRDYHRSHKILYDPDYKGDTSVHVKWHEVHVWGGKSFYINRMKSSFFLTGHYDWQSYHERPEETSASRNPRFHNYNQFLMGTGFYHERFYKASMIYGFGVQEYIPAGYKTELIGGYRWGEFNDSWYMGLNLSWGHFPQGNNYLMGRVFLGSYFDSVNKWEQSAWGFNLRYFSRLLAVKKWRVRQFLGLNYMRGWNRYDGADEYLDFTDNSGPRGFTEHVYGRNRGVLNTETVMFSPWAIYGFKVAMFASADFGLIGNDANLFKNDFYTTIGLGVRLRNERFVFSTIQVRLGVCLGKKGFVDNKYFGLSRQQRMDDYRYLPKRPEPVKFW